MNFAFNLFCSGHVGHNDGKSEIAFSQIINASSRQDNIGTSYALAQHFFFDTTEDHHFPFSPHFASSTPILHVVNSITALTHPPPCPDSPDLPLSFPPQIKLSARVLTTNISADVVVDLWGNSLSPSLSVLCTLPPSISYLSRQPGPPRAILFLYVS